MFQLLGRMIKLPLEAFVYSMEMFVKTVQGMQQIAYQGIDLLAAGGRQPSLDAAGDKRDVTRVAVENVSEKGAELAPPTTSREVVKMADKNLSGEDLKLVRYKILFIKRDYEHAFEEQEELVHDNTSEAAFTAWKIGQFIQDLGNKRYRYPGKWENDGDLKKHKSSEGYLMGFPEDDKKYLRVYFEVLERYPREPPRYEERQLGALRDISEKLGNISDTLGHVD
jgi:hypothetical protein